MNIGRLRHRIILQQRQHRPSDYGAPVAEWRDVRHVWAEVKPLSAREYFAHAQIQSDVTTQIWLRYLPDLVVDGTMRVVFGGRFYEIVSAINYKSLNKTLLLQCKEVADDR